MTRSSDSGQRRVWPKRMTSKPQNRRLRASGRRFLPAWTRRCGITLLAAAFAVSTAAAQQGPGRGTRSPDLRPCDEHWDHGRRVKARGCYLELIDSDASPTTKAEAFWGLRNFKQANEMFREALQAQPEDPDVRVRWGYLFLETHNAGEAAKLFDEALKLDEDHAAAKLGKAGVFSRRFEGKARELMTEVLDANPELYEAYVLKASMDIEENDFKKANESLDKALEKAKEQDISPLEAYSLKAAIDFLGGAAESEWVTKTLERNPTYGRVYADPAHFYVITRRYREAADLYLKAVETDGELWSAHADLAVNLMREGKDDEAARHLELAYRGDPFSAKTVNTLRLLDSFKNFKTYSNFDQLLPDDPDQLAVPIDRPQVIVRLHEKESEILRPYVVELAERSLETFAAKYQFKPERPVIVELYPDHDDFAVRTMGMPGVGLLGVTFGYLIAMDSPSGRAPGSFHWGTTLWHEMAHVVTLESTNHLVPRWYSEGISVYEEWAADDSWGDRISPDVIKAIEEKKFLPVADLDKGFIRPSYPKQIQISYFQSGLVCKFIAEKWGFGKLVELLRGFGEGKSTADNVEAVLGMPSEEFDTQFTEYVQAEAGELVEHHAEWRKLMKQALEAARAKKWEDVIEPAKKARDAYPQYVEAGNAYAVLAEAYLKLDDKEAAVEQLLEYESVGGRNPSRLKKLATLLHEMDRTDEAIEVLEGLLYIAPGDEELHAPLGQWLLAAGRIEEAAREFKSLLAVGPVDAASAHFNLARAYHKMEDRQRTRRHLLMALETAPGYRPAQKLLLEINQ